MRKNTNLTKARKETDNNEFYTRMKDIEEELQHYTEHFEGKTVFCNCDDPFESNFFKYFALNFNKLKLKKLISLSYPNSPAANNEFEFKEIKDDFGYHIELTKVPEEINCTKLRLLIEKAKAGIGPNKFKIIESWEGSYESNYNINLLKKADIVCTNPPFSFFKEYVHLIIKYNKKFLILGNANSAAHNGIFPLIQRNKMWCGYNVNKRLGFECPERKDKSMREKNRTKIHIRYVAPVSWYTNLETIKKHTKLDLCCKYDPEIYPKFDNFDVINVDKVKEIPCDYDDIMGVPVSFIGYWNPEQFKIIGMFNGGQCENNFGIAYLNGKKKYARILIQKVQKNKLNLKKSKMQQKIKKIKFAIKTKNLKSQYGELEFDFSLSIK